VSGATQLARMNEACGDEIGQRAAWRKSARQPPVSATPRASNPQLRHAGRQLREAIIRPLCDPGGMTVVSLLDRQVYLYSEVDRLAGLRAGTARRWINGYQRAGKSYEPILRTSAVDTEWVTWGEFVEARMLAEYRDQNIPTARLREAVAGLREMFDLAYPLAHLGPYLAAESGELEIDRQQVDPSDDPGAMILRTKQLLLAAPSRAVMDRATLGVDALGQKFAADLIPDPRFPGIVVSPDRLSGQPTFVGRRVSVATIAGMVEAGEAAESLAADYGLSLAQVQDATGYITAHGVAA